MSLLICADPGARANFVAAWLQDQLQPGLFDVGAVIPAFFRKLHTDWGNLETKIFPGKKIRIQTTYRMLDLHLYLFLKKNAYPQLPDLNKDEFSYDVTNKLIESAKEWFEHDRQIDAALYHKSFPFSHTFDTDFMIGLYHWFNRASPSRDMVDSLVSVNKHNMAHLPGNHSSRVAAMILEKENLQGLKEIERFWSLAAIYESNDRNTIYKTIWDAIHRDNYGKSDLYGIGVNDITTRY